MKILLLGATGLVGQSGWDPAGEDPAREVEDVRLVGAPSVCGWLRDQLYTPSGFKQVPPVILNADTGRLEVDPSAERLSEARSPSGSS